MSDHPRDPVRWRDRSDQSDPAERRAGHAVRCRRAMGFRPAPPLARVASRMRSARVRRRLTWVVVTATFLFGSVPQPRPRISICCLIGKPS